MKRASVLGVIGLLTLSGPSFLAPAWGGPPEDDALAADLKLLQGSWQLVHGGGGTGSTRSVKTVKGNVETVRRYNAKTGDLIREHSVEFQLSRSGSVHVFTFYRIGGSPEVGSSFIYKVDKNNFWDIPGLLQGSDYRNYQATPQVWHWKRVPDKSETPSNVDAP